MSELYLGLMSGTSLDGIDAALVDFSNQRVQLIAAATQDFDASLHHDLRALLNKPADITLPQLSDLDARLGEAFAQHALSLIAQAGLNPSDIRAIGSHGQTVWHQPDGTWRNSLQIGDPNRITQRTGITTVADFRRADMAQGGQGAPLVPAFHEAVFRSPEVNRCIVNVGGIANITILPKERQHPVIGYDTGPGNVLMDAWTQRHNNRSFDENGNWAAQGKVIKTLLNSWLDQNYFHRPFPKSTGREWFNASWLDQYAGNEMANNVQSSLLELTAQSIVQEIQKHEVNEIYVCGGGSSNTALMQRLSELLPDQPVSSTQALQVPPNDVEAMAFAWLAKQRMESLPGNCPTVTGARNPGILGSIYCGT